jgi:hypothetical protein
VTRLPAVPVYISPTRVILTTLACALEVAAAGFAAAAIVAEVTRRVLNDHPIYGPRRPA